MALTLDEAARAGALAAAVVAIDEAISGLNARISEGAEITSMIAQLATGNSVRAEMPMSAQESASVFDAVLTILRAKRAGLMAALDAIS